MVGTPSSPRQLRLLAIMPIERQGDWLRACFLCGGGRDLQVFQVATVHDAAAALRQQSYDLLLLWHEGAGQGLLERWSQLAQLDGDAGFVALGMHVCEGWQQPLYAAGALACLDMDQTDPITLVHTLRMSAELEGLRRDSQAWERERQRMREREARDIDRMLAGQRLLLDRLDQFGGAPAGLADESSPIERPTAVDGSSSDPLLEELSHIYLHALQNFIFDETQSAAAAIADLAERFIHCESTSSTLMRVHLAAVTQITSQGGAGSMRHCLAGADRFVMELLMRLVDRQIRDHQAVDCRGNDRHDAGRQGGDRPGMSDTLELARKGRLQSVASPLAAA